MPSDQLGSDASQSIAVLPFANMSRDPDDEYFSDGLAEEILNLLAKIPALKVTARTSSFAFRGIQQDIRKIGEALSVRTVLEGSVRRSGSRIRVTAQLIGTADGYHLWSERYDREMTDIFAVQDEISEAIAAELKVKLTGKDAAATREHEPGLQAYEAYLKGRYHYYKFNPDAVAAAETCFRDACTLDPKWADPHAGLSDIHFSMGFFGWGPLNESLRRSRTAAHRALELQPSQPLARAMLGVIAGLHDYDWKEAGEQFRMALEQKSANPNIHLFHAMFYLLPLGQFDAAEDVMAKAVAEDPLNGMWHSRQAWMLVCAERYDQAMVEAQKALELNEADYQAYMMLSLCNGFQGRQDLALQHASTVNRLAPWDSLGVGLYAGLLARTGDQEGAAKVLSSMKGAIPIGMVIYYLITSEIELGLDWYQREIEERRPNGPMIASAGFLEPFRLNLRWSKLARMMNLPRAGR